MESDASSLPAELLENTQPIIGFTGLDIAKNAVHKTIWDAFNSNRKSDRATIQFKLIPPNFEFPVSKPKHQSYEWNHPKGILKRNWMAKHLHVLPAVIVLFQDIEWNDQNWTEKQYQCASLMQSLKNSLQNRKTKLAIVLLQRNSPRPQGEDPLATERAAHLSSVCEISTKMLFILPHNDHLMGYTLRLESAFLEMSQTYYSEMSKQIRVHRDQLTSAHQGLKVRHQFKMGFISEMKLDFNTALKHYTQAYANLDEIRIVDTNCLEIKTVAGFINYKICKIMFKIGSPRGAITHFENHIDKYHDRSGFQELIFEHFSWLSVQYSSFAELFCEAIKNGLPAIQTEHPGIYYRNAAEYTTKRKEAFLRCCELMPPGQLSPLKEEAVANYSSILHSEFFGVRGGTKTLDPSAEQQIFAAIKEIERGVNHSAIIIALLGQAMAQFKIYKCPRHRKKLAIDMAEEYLKCGDHSKALTLYSLMLTDYRSEKWYNIFTDVLLKTLRSAFLSYSVPDFIECSVEALSNRILMENTDRIIVLENLWKVFHNVPPIAPSQIAPELKRNWEVALSSFKKTITIDLDKISELFECSVTFEKSQVRQNEVVRVNAFIRSASTVALKMRDFSIHLSDTVSSFKLHANHYIEMDEAEIHQISRQSREFADSDEESRIKKFDNAFMLDPNLCYKISFESEPNQFSESSELQITKLEVLMGSSSNFIVLAQSSTLNKLNCFKSFNPKHDCLKNFNSNRSCYVVPIFHLATQNNLQNQPMLVNEYFQVVTTINNSFDIALQNVGLSITVPESLRNKVFISSDLTKGRQRLSSQIQMDIGDVQMQSNTSISYYITSLVEGNIELIQKSWYQTENIQGPVKPGESNPSSIENSPVYTTAVSLPAKKNQQRQNHNIQIEYINGGLKKMREDTVIIPCIEEFRLSGKFYTLSKEALTRAFRNEDFLLRIDLELKAPCDIDILDMFLICDHNISQRLYSKQGRKLTKYSKGQKIRDVIILRANQTSVDWIESKEFLQGKSPKALFAKSKTPDRIVAPDFKLKGGPKILQKPVYKTPDNLLSKIPINATVTSGGNVLKPTGSNTPLNQSFNEDLQTPKSDGLEVMTMSNSNLNLNKMAGESQPNASSILTTKSVYTNAIDAFHLTDHCKGFLNKDCIGTLAAAPGSGQALGVYCIKWRRTGTTAENETKLLVNGIEIVEAPLNVYCYLDEKVYVKMPMTLTIALKNTSSTTLHLKSYLKNAENFMFAGNTQLNLSIFAGSEYNLSFNLYPLKAGWQSLPEFELKYNTPEDAVSQLNDELFSNYELQNLVNRWMPKKIYIIPMIRHIK